MSLKPPVPHVIPGHALHPGLRAVAPLAEGSGPPADLASGSPVASAFASGTDGTTWSPPAWGVDPLVGAFLSYRYDGTAGSYTQACRFPGDPTQYVSGTLFAVVRPVLPFAGDAIFCRSGNGQNPGDFTLGCDPFGVLRAYLRVAPRAGDTPITLAPGKWHALAAAFESSTGLLTLYAANLSDGGAAQASSTTLGDVSFTQVHSSGIWSIGQTFNVNYQGNFDVALAGWSGSTTTGAATPGSVWDATAFANFLGDVYGVVRPNLTVSPTSVAPGVSNQAFALTSNVGSYTPGSPGSPIITVGGAVANTPQTVADGSHVNLSVAATGTGGNVLTFTDPVYEVSATAGVTSASATDFTLTPPSPASGNLGVASGSFTIAPDGSYTGTATLSDGGAGGTFTPASLTWAAESTGKTFTYTPAGAAGVDVITATLSGLSAKSANYTAGATALAGGFIARRSGTATSVTLDGHAGYGNVAGVQAGGTAASGGQGMLGYQWFQLPRADTPLAGSPGTLLAGQTSADATITGLARFAEYNFVRRVTDGVGATAWSNVAAVSTLADLAVGVVLGGDSLTAGIDAAEFEGTLKGPSNDTYLKFPFDDAHSPPYWNAGVSASKSADWLPTASTPTATGNDSVARPLLLNAEHVASTIAADLRVFALDIGVNDIDAAGMTPAGVAANVATICAHALAHGFDLVVLSSATDAISGPYGTPANRAALQDLRAALAALHDGATVFFSDHFHLLAAGRVDFHDDGAGNVSDPLHDNALGCRARGRTRAVDVLAALHQFLRPFPPSGGGATISASRSGQRRRGR